MPAGLLGVTDRNAGVPPDVAEAVPPAAATIAVTAPATTAAFAREKTMTPRDPLRRQRAAAGRRRLRSGHYAYFTHQGTSTYK
jgi:hypothetical protein